MKVKKQYFSRWLYVVAGLVVLSGILISAWIFLRNRNSGKTIAFTNVNLIPMTSETVIENQTVLVKGSEIVAIGDSDKVKIPAGAQVIDGKGAYLMPGLADMHAHTRISTRAVGSALGGSEDLAGSPLETVPRQWRHNHTRSKRDEMKRVPILGNCGTKFVRAGGLVRPFTHQAKACMPVP